ncbi:MAG: hypothetical protein ACYCYI_10030 [Saccharofermentanales bacterium]
MKNRIIEQQVDSSKATPIIALFTTAILIILLGTVLSVYSLINNISFTVLSSQIHGAIWGVVIIFLGARYLFSVKKLKAEVYKSTSRFSWENFRSKK